MSPKISVILPSRNEKDTIGHCIKEIKKVAREENLSLEIIVSDSSNDGSHEIAEREGIMVIKHDQEGYGFAIKEGVTHARGEIIIYADADNTYRFADIPKFLKELENCDIVIGSRLRGIIEKGAMPLPHRFLGTPLFNLLLKMFFGIKISDSQSGYRAMKRKTFFDLDLKTNGMEFATEMIIKAHRMHFCINEIPTDYALRGGISKLRRYRDGFAHLKYILLQAPLTFFLGGGGILFFLGILGLLGGNDIHRFFTLATVKIFFPVLGIQIIFFGFFAKTYLMTRFGEKNEFMKNFYSKFKFSSALMLGLLFITFAIIIRVAGAGNEYFDIILVSALIGSQIIFNSMVLSTLSIK